MDFLVSISQSILGFFYKISGNYGVAIILLTLVVKVVLMPFNISQMRASRKMQEVAPKVKELQKKYKSDPQRLNQETMALYKEHGVNPIVGCLPILLQLPILLALFRALQAPIYTDTPMFLGLNLSLPNPETGALALGVAYWILPALAAVTTYLQTLVTMPPSDDPSQKMMLYFMPLLIGWFSLQFSSGLSLYWVVSNVFSIIQGYLTPKTRTPVAGGNA